MEAYIDSDGVVRLEALGEGLVDELAEPPVCTWCAVEVFRARFRGDLIWAHRTTGLLVCSGQVTGGWEPLRNATPSQWRVADWVGRARTKRSRPARPTG